MTHPPWSRASLSVRGKLLALSGLLVLGFAGAGAQQFAVLDRYRIGGPVHARLEAETTSIEVLTALLAELHRLDATLRSLTAHPSMDELRLVRTRVKEIGDGVEARFARVRELQAQTGGDPGHDAAITWDQLSKEIVQRLADDGVNHQTLDLFLNGPHRRQYARMVGELEDGLNALRLRTHQLKQKTEASVRRAKALNLATGAVLGLVLLVLSYQISQSILRRLLTIVRLAERVGQGDLTVELPPASGDELGRVADGLGQMVARLRGLVKALTEAAGDVAGAVERMRRIASEQITGTERQASAVRETQVTAEEIRQASRIAFERASLLRRSSEVASEVGRAGAASLEASREGIESIRTGIDEIGERIKVLDTRAQSLGRVARTIKDITDQTNMLALNAAMEAMRAGPQGKTFAVVAREMRALTDRAIESAKEIDRELAATQDALHLAVLAAERGRAGIGSGLNELEASAGALLQLAEMLHRSSSGVSEIATAVGQQDTGISQIFAALHELGAVLSQSEATVQQIHDSIGLLETAATRVRSSAAAFQV